MRSRILSLRHPRRAARLARTLWILWAVVVWNVVFDRVIVVANMDDFMRPAVARGLWIASAAGGAVLLVGLAGVRVAVQRGVPAARVT